MRIPEHTYFIDLDKTADLKFLQGQMECAMEFENYERAGQLKKVIETRFPNQSNT